MDIHNKTNKDLMACWGSDSIVQNWS